MKDFEVLVLDGTNPSGVAMTRDILEAARLFALRNGQAAPTWSFHSVQGGTIRLQGGLSIETRRLPTRSASQAAVVLVPGVWVEDARHLHERLRREDCARVARYLARRARAGACIAASCSAVFLLHAAGLLEGRQATTTWWLAPELARIAPQTRMDGNRILCVDGALITAGAAFAQSDVMLYVLRQRFGPRLVEGVSRVLLLHERTEVAQFVVPSMLASGDALVSRLARRVEAALPTVPSVADLAGELCVSERTLGRHVRRATGMGTNAMIQGIRVQRARTLLRTTRMSVEQVALAVGYQDSTALRRLMRKAVGTTPGRVRGAAAVSGEPREQHRARTNSAKRAVR